MSWKRFYSVAAVAVVMFVSVACEGGDTIASPDLEPLAPQVLFSVVGANTCANSDAEVGKFKLVKLGGSGVFDVLVEDPDGNIVDQRVVSLDAGDCALLATTPDDRLIVTVTETSSIPASIECVQLRYDGFVRECSTVTTTSASNKITGKVGGLAIFANFNPVEGRMTGGGHQLRVDGARVTRGLTLHCDNTLSNNLEINWPGGNNWHLERESLESISCIDDPNFDPVPPAAPFDTFIATAIGSLNNVDGSIIEFRFIDDGEPGRTDEAHFTIYDVNQGPGQVAPGSEVIVLQVSGQLDGGNLQAHFDQPHN